MTDKEIENLKMEQKRYRASFLAEHDRNLELEKSILTMSEESKDLKEKEKSQKERISRYYKSEKNLKTKLADREEELKVKTKIIKQQEKVIETLFNDNEKFESYKNWVEFECKYVKENR